MTGWQDSQSTDRRHKHLLVKDSQGQNVCQTCWQVVINPITDSEDPRLEFAGLMRSRHHELEDDNSEFPPTALPVILIALHEEGPDVGYRRAPAAPYIVAVLSNGDGSHSDSLWEDLASKF